MNIEDEAGAVFLSEARDLVAAIERGLMDLERSPGEVELINAVFRDLHTVKGSGAMFGHTEMAQFVHGFETAFDSLRSGDAKVASGVIAVSLKACDQILALLVDPQGAAAASGTILTELAAALGSGSGAVAGAETGALAAGTGAGAAGGAEAAGTEAESEAAGWRVVMRLAPDALRLGHNPALLLDELADLGPCTVRALTDRIPPLPLADPTDCLIGWEVEIAAALDRSAIEDVFIFHDGQMELEITPLGGTSARLGAGASEPVPAQPAPAAAVPEGAAGAVPEQPTPAAPSQQSAPAAPSAAPSAAPARADAPPARPQPAQPAPASGDTMRVSTERLDELMDRVGELVIAEARLQSLAQAGRDPALMAVSEDIQRLAAGLRDSTMSMRMVPIGSITGRFRRLIRDLSEKLGKSVRFETQGEETELDKTVIELLADPLVHILRNSADHGLEGPAERVASGKPEAGTITLSALYSGAEVVIEVRDDGRGLDAGKLRARAVQRGLIAADAQLTEAETWRLIFEPGFSTAETVTELSGRGVGMDVVGRTIDQLRGQIEVDSEPGHGVTVRLRLPLTLAIIDGLLIELGGEHYTIPLAAVEECVELPPQLARETAESSFLNIRGALVPFLRLRKLFDVGPPPPDFQKVVIVNASGQRVGLVVDRLVGNNQTVIKQLSRLHAGLRGFSGATILGDGTVALILDVPQIVAAGRLSADRGGKERAA